MSNFFESTDPYFDFFSPKDSIDQEFLLEKKEESLNIFKLLLDSGFSFASTLENLGLLTKVGGLPVNLTRAQLAADDAFEQKFKQGLTTRAVADDATDSHTVFSNEVALALTLGTALNLKSGRYRDSTGSLTFTSSVLIKGEGNRLSILYKNHASNAFRIAPTGVSGGTCNARSVGDTTVTNASATWTVDEHAGKHVHINNAGTPQVRTVVSNTSTVLTLDEPLGVDVANGVALTFYTLIPEVILSSFAIEAAGGSANVVIEHVKTVIIRDFRSDGCTGNALTIDWCDFVTVLQYQSNTAQFCLFIYFCGVVLVSQCLVQNWTSTYGVQVKDCKYFGIVENVIGVGGDTAVDIKGSGVNPSRNLTAINCWGYDCDVAVLAHCLNNEGTGFKADNHSIIGGGSHSCGTGLSLVESGGGSFTNLYVAGFQAMNSTVSGAAIGVAGAVVQVTVEGSQQRAINIAGADRLQLDAIVKNNNMDSSARPEIRADNSSDCTINIWCEHTDDDSGSNRIFQSINTDGPCDNLTVNIKRIIDTAATPLAEDIIFSETTSKAFSEYWGNVIESTMVSRCIQPKVVHMLAATKTYTSDTTVADLGFPTHNVQPSGIYKWKLMLMVDGAVGGDGKAGVTAPASTAGFSGITAAPGIAATVSDDNSEHAATNGVGSIQEFGTLGNNTFTVVVIEGVYAVDSTGGVLTPRGAQRSSSATATRFLARSTFEVEKIA